MACTSACSRRNCLNLECIFYDDHFEYSVFKFVCSKFISRKVLHHSTAIWTKHLMPFHFQDICAINSKYNTPTVFHLRHPLSNHRNTWVLHKKTDVEVPLGNLLQCSALPFSKKSPVRNSSHNYQSSV